MLLLELNIQFYTQICISTY